MKKKVKKIVESEAIKPEEKKPEEPDIQPEEPVEEKPKRFAFFVGCTTQIKLPYIEKLSRQIFEKLGIALVDLDFTCCPTSRIVRDVDINSWLYVAGRNLAVAEKEKLDLLVMCTGCTQTLKEAKHALEDSDTRKALNEKLKDIGLVYEGTSEVVFYGQLLHEMKDDIKIEKKIPLRIASHSGCHILRPSSILKFDDPENPVKLDELIKITGADAVDYPKKGLCCGFPIYETDEAAAKQMMKDKMSTINADYMAVLCPTCFEYYELRQKPIAEEMGFRQIPVMHYMMLLGLAMGFSAEEVGFQFLKNKDERILN